jgi:3-hydroxyisobutyrate dehydrogenase-like beta-hydroxyacid dehydrogenase
MTPDLGPIGFIGTGTIGAPMARRLVEAGHALVVCDRNPAATEPLVAAGASRAADPREVATRCRVVLTSLPGPADVAEVAAGRDGLLTGARAGDVHVDLSTSAWDAVRALAEREAAAGVHLVDAPVSGGAIGATQGTLTVMASGERSAFERAEPLLGAFGRNVFYLGASGNGTLTKLVNNAIFLCGGLLVQETFAMAAKAGLDPSRLLDVVQKSSGAVYANLAKLLLSHRFDDPFFQLALAEKDVALALASAKDLGAPMPVIEAAHATYARALAMGLGPKLFAATLLAVEDAAGVTVPDLSPAGGSPPS